MLNTYKALFHNSTGMPEASILRDKERNIKNPSTFPAILYDGHMTMKQIKSCS